jgi:hypothetical protein
MRFDWRYSNQGNQDDDEGRVDGVDSALGGIFSEFPHHVLWKGGIEVPEYHPDIKSEETHHQKAPEVRMLHCFA